MGEAVFHASDQAKEVFHIASEVTGIDMAETCFGSQTDRLGETLIAQPAIATVSIAEYLHLKELGVRFDAAMGHSMGEMSLLAMSGLLSVRETLELLKVRAEATSNASKDNPGIMTAISGLTVEQIRTKAAHIMGGARIAIANLNGTRQQVFSGDQEPMQELEELVRNMRVGEKLKVSATKLRTGGAFHSEPHMKGAVAEFRAALESKKYKAPEFELMLNNARYLSEMGTERLPEYLSRQLVSPVDFVGGSQRLVGDGVVNYIEVGPVESKAKYRVLSGLLKREFGETVRIIEVSENSNNSKRNPTES